MNLILDSVGDGVLVWIRKPDVTSKLPPTFRFDVRNCDIVVTGFISEYDSLQTSWKGRLEISLDDPTKIQVLGRETEDIHPLQARASSAPSEVWDALDAARLQSSINADRLVHGTVSSAHVTQAGNSLVINMTNDSKGFQVFVPGTAFRDFTSRYGLGDPDELVGRDLLVFGTIVDYHRCAGDHRNQRRKYRFACEPHDGSGISDDTAVTFPFLFCVGWPAFVAGNKLDSISR